MRNGASKSNSKNPSKYYWPCLTRGQGISAMIIFLYMICYILYMREIMHPKALNCILSLSLFFENIPIIFFLKNKMGIRSFPTVKKNRGVTISKRMHNCVWLPIMTHKKIKTTQRDLYFFQFLFHFSCSAPPAFYQSFVSTYKC